MLITHCINPIYQNTLPIHSSPYSVNPTYQHLLLRMLVQLNAYRAANATGDVASDHSAGNTHPRPNLYQHTHSIYPYYPHSLSCANTHLSIYLVLTHSLNLTLMPTHIHKHTLSSSSYWHILSTHSLNLTLIQTHKHTNTPQHCRWQWQ